MKGRAQSLPDLELVRQFRDAGNGECFAELFMRHRKHVYSSCRRFFGNSQAAEDATQETFLRAYRGIESFQHGEFSPWLMRIARNVCIDEYRKRRTGEEVMVGGEAAELSALSDGGLESHLLVTRIWHEMRYLSPEQRQCLELKIEGYSYEETAVRTGFPVEAVKSYIQNGRRMLWRKLEGALAQAK